MIGDKLEFRMYNENEVIIRKGEEGDCMYVLYQGEVNVFASDEEKLTCTLHESQVFCERALEKVELRSATVVAALPKTICLALHLKDFKDVLYVILSLNLLACLSPSKVKETTFFANNTLL